MRDLVSENARQRVSMQEVEKAKSGRYSQKPSGASRHQHPPEEWGEVRQIRVRNELIKKVRQMVEFIEDVHVTDREAIDIALNAYRQQNAELAAECAAKQAAGWADG